MPLTPSSLLAITALMAVATSAFAQPHPRFTRVFQIGGDDGPEETTFGFVADVQFGFDGSVYVLDNANAVVRVFDTAGRHLRSFGRKGDGPGELRFPTRLLVGTDRVTVFDGAAQRAVVFSLDGDAIETRPMAESGVRFDAMLPMRHGAWLGAKSTIQTDARFNRLGRERPRTIRQLGAQLCDGSASILALVNPEASTVDTIFRWDHGLVLQFTERGAGPLPRSWPPGGAWAVSGDSLVALIDGFRGRVRILSIGSSGPVEVRSERIPIPPIPLSESDWRAVADSLYGERGLRFEGVVVGPPYRAQLGAPVFAQDGALWIRRIGPELRPASVPYLVLPGGGGPALDVELPAGLDIRAVRGDLLLAVSASELGVHRIEQWRMEPR